MEQRRATIDEDSIVRATDTAKHYSEKRIAAALEFLKDPRKKARLESVQCKFCFYMCSERIGGAAMTNRPCGICAEDMLFSSTTTNEICNPCGMTYQICVYCGGDLHMRIRRKISLPKVL